MVFKLNFASGMHYFSTNRRSPKADFREATLRGQPDDKGLYFPESIPKLSAEFLNSFREMANGTIAFEVIRPYVGDTIGEEELRNICNKTVDMSFPLVEISDRISTLELFHGPTLAFKDVGARFISQCLHHFAMQRNKKTLVLVATSGDTGGAVAAGLHGSDMIEVVIFYPKGMVSPVQELQLTTAGGNVAAVEVNGTFDDCQAIAKQALADGDISKKAFVTSANSINVARWLPQQFYYFYALKQWEGKPPVFAVPSGNFGNICAGILAGVSGMPSSGFLAACNANSVVPDFLRTGEYTPKPAISTMSNAMDVGDPSNFVRILEIFNNKYPKLIEQMDAVSVSDKQTLETIKAVFADGGYILDPHGAVGYRALADHLVAHPDQKGIFLETAHPIKFDVVEEILGNVVPMPPAVADLLGKEKVSIAIDTDYEKAKEIVLSRI